MNLSKTTLFILIPVISLLFFGVSAFAAAPDGAGPWADSVLSSSQGLMKNGGAVPAIRSNSASALGVAEDNNTDGNFFSLGFGGNIILGFDNGVSNGAMIVETTNPGYPGETANVEMSEDGVNWIMAGSVTQDGTVDIPDQLTCAQYVRITDTSNPAIMPDDIADGYDVDGVQATGESCTPAPSPSPSPSASPSSSPSSIPSSSPSSSTTTTTSTTSGGSTPCTSSGVTQVPTITEATRVSATSILVSWSSGSLNNFVVRYGFEDGSWLYSTNVSGTSTTIGSLPANQPVWFQVAATDNCVTGTAGGSVLVSGTSPTLIPGFPNAGGNPLVPGFPNAGIGPDDWSILGSIDYILSILSKALNFKL